MRVENVKTWYLIAFLLLALTFVGLGILEYNGRKQDILNVMQGQASTAAGIITLNQNLYTSLTNEISQVYVERALDLLYTIDRLEWEGLLRGRWMEELISDMPVFDVNIFNSEREFVLGSYYAPFQWIDKENQQNILNLLEPVFQRDDDELVIFLNNLQVSNDLPLPDNTFIVAIKRSWGGVIAGHLTLDAANDYLLTTDSKSVLKQIVDMDAISYIKISSELIEDILIADDDWTEPTIANQSKERLTKALTTFNTPSGSFIEVEIPDYDKKSNSSMFIGFHTYPISELKRQIFSQILIRSILLTIIIIASLRFLTTHQKTTLLKQEKQKIEDDVRKLEVINRLQEKQAAIGELAAGITHELRNPLNAISIISQRLKKEFAPIQDKKEYNVLVDNMIAEATRVNDSLEDFLQYSRPTPLNMTILDINELLHEVSTILESEALNKGVQIKVYATADNPVYGDRLYLLRALTNLIKNAIDASKNGDSIRIKSSEIESNILIDVVDEGVGIAPENKNRIFDLYYTTKEEGTGVGLAITHKIIADHKGRIEVDSTLGRGTTFRIYIPRIDR